MMSEIVDWLRKRFPNPDFSEHYEGLISKYMASGLAPPNTSTEITSGDRGLCAHIWEAMLYRHLSSLGYEFRRGNVRKAGQRGPDFGIVHEGRTIWIEAIVASPEGIPPDYLRPPEPGEFKAGSFPHQEILLRWTSALRDKRAKLQKYVVDDVVPATDRTIIAINGCRTTGGYQDNGISQMPFAVEAVFPVGSLAVRVNRNDGRIVGDAYHTARFSVEKPNGAPVPTDSFFNRAYSNVSAVLGCGRGHMLHGGLPLAVVHNLLAKVPLQHGILGANKEFVPEDEGDAYSLRRL
jgi:type I restriction enzyme S subunit